MRKEKYLNVTRFEKPQTPEPPTPQPLIPEIAKSILERTKELADQLTDKQKAQLKEYLKTPDELLEEYNSIKESAIFPNFSPYQFKRMEKIRRRLNELGYQIHW